MGGRLDVICFDKTGTLTEEGLDVLGLRVLEHPSKRCAGSGSVIPDVCLLTAIQI